MQIVGFLTGRLISQRNTRQKTEINSAVSLNAELAAQVSHVMRKQTFHICENKGVHVDQLRSNTHAIWNFKIVLRWIVLLSLKAKLLKAFHSKMKLVLNDMQISNIKQSLQENYHGLLPNFDV